MAGDEQASAERAERASQLKARGRWLAAWGAILGGELFRSDDGERAGPGGRQPGIFSSAAPWRGACDVA